MKRVIQKFKNIRTNKLSRSMFLSTLSKPVSMIISLIYTPILLNYLGEESYGLWATILSIINWINYFDIGIGNGLRNMLTADIEDNNQESAKRAVSTGYIALSTIAGSLLIIGGIVIISINTKIAFNTTISIKPALFISFICICINFILALSKVQLYATHQAEKVGFMTLMTQLLNLLGILVISLFTKGNIIIVAVVVGFSGIIINVFFTGKIWTKYPYLLPAYNSFDMKKLKGICNVGIKFFIIQMAALVLYSTDYMIIIRLFGPENVTPYHTVYTAFGIVNGLFAAMISPLWSKYTVAVLHKDFHWIKKTIISLDKLLPVFIIILSFASITFEHLSVIWLQKELVYDNGLITCMGIYYILIIWGSIYATAMNGMRRINLQLILGISSAILNIPLSIFLGWYLGMGTTGVALATIVCMFITNLIVTIDMHKYLNSQIRISLETSR